MNIFINKYVLPRGDKNIYDNGIYFFFSFCIFVKKQILFNYFLRYTSCKRTWRFAFSNGRMLVGWIMKPFERNKSILAVKTSQRIYEISYEFHNI